MIDPSILEEAAAIVNGDKQQQYGHPSVHYARVAAGWETIFADGIFSEERVALAMVWFKICRQLQTNKRDNIVDAIGYLLTADAVIEQQRKAMAPVNPLDKPWPIWKIDLPNYRD